MEPLRRGNIGHQRLVTCVISLNVNHRTVGKPIPQALVTALLDLAPDVLVLVEYVAGAGRPDLHAALASAGLLHAATSHAEQEAGAAQGADARRTLCPLAETSSTWLASSGEEQ